MFNKLELIFKIKIIVTATSISDAILFLFFNYNDTSIRATKYDKPRFKHISL